VVTKSFAVADIENERVLIYNAPFSSNQSASVVLGQADFTHGEVNQGGGVAANTLYAPTGLAMDLSGNLYVPDSSNCRVLQFVPPFTNNMSATLVFGQTVMTQTSCKSGTGATASGLANLLYSAVDSQGDLWVSDSLNARIVEYVPPFTSGMAATLAIGQSGTGALSATPCNQGAASPTASTLCNPVGIAFDSTGNLWTADFTNNRVLEFKKPFTSGMAASLELGQPSATAFTSSTFNNGGISASTLHGPLPLMFDSAGDLWVGDAHNARVLEFVPPFSNGMNATLELGQIATTPFTGSGCSQSQNGLCYPYGLARDTGGDIFITDSSFNRVMIFEPPFSNGMNATTVLGQTNFSADGNNQGGSIGANTLYSPAGGVTF
jgi:sugar lactone lactonase YvrE